MIRADGEGVAAGERAWYHTNDLGTVLATTDAAGEMIGSWIPDFNGDYADNGYFGVTFPGSPTRPEIGLTGKYWDDAAGLYYFNARWLDPERARWLSREPLGLDGPNLYHFGFGQIVNGFDPNGLSWLSNIADLLVAGYDAAANTTGRIAKGAINKVTGFFEYVPSLEGKAQQKQGNANLAMLDEIGATPGCSTSAEAIKDLTTLAGVVVVETVLIGSSRITVLGHAADNYVDVAKANKANYFKLSDALWNNLDDAARWDLNLRFLDDAIKNGDMFRLTRDPRLAFPDTYFAAEIGYLLENGYKIVKDSDGIFWLVK